MVTHTDLGKLSRHPWNEIVVDGRGNVYLNSIAFNFPGLRVREGGEVLEAIELDRTCFACFACMLDGEDGRTLFMVAAEWTGRTELAGTEPTGNVFTARAPAPRSGARKGGARRESNHDT
jgi:sugar lactone lactonase YvrE